MSCAFDTVVAAIDRACSADSLAVAGRLGFIRQLVEHSATTNSIADKNCFESSFATFASVAAAGPAEARWPFAGPEIHSCAFGN
jgi:hypothetical protein